MLGTIGIKGAELLKVVVEGAALSPEKALSESKDHNEDSAADDGESRSLEQDQLKRRHWRVD